MFQALRKLFLLIIFASILTACVPAQLTPAPQLVNTQNTSVAITTPVVKTPSILPTFLPISPFLTAPSTSALPTQTPLPVVLPKFPLEGYIMLFAKNGDLYFQDGNNLPVKLAHVGESFYNISDDNKRVAFGVGNLINTDGTQEKSIFPNDWWDSTQLWGTELGGVDFVPGTHQLIFSTHLCNSYDNPTTCVSSIFLTDTDKGEIKRLADLGFSGPLIHENFKVSPNGKMVAVMTATSVGILNINGKVIRHDVLSYTPKTPDIIFPSLFWLPDSSGLIVALPNTFIDSAAYNYISAYTIWRYKIDNNIVVQIPFIPPPMALGNGNTGDEIQVSPNGKWIIYGGLGYNPEVYLGNLENGHVQIVGEANQAHFSWAPDSKHFLVTSAGSVIGSIDSRILKDFNNCGGWIDSNHLSCYIDNINNLGVAEIVPRGLNYYDFGFGKDVKGILIKPK